MSRPGTSMTWPDYGDLFAIGCEADMVTTSKFGKF